MHRIRIDGQECTVEEGTSVLAAAARLGLSIPALCHDPRLTPGATCRLCAVEVEGADNPVMACITPARDGMAVDTATPALLAFRAQELRWYASHVRPSAAALMPDKLLHRLLRQHAIAPANLDPEAALDTSHPCIRVDMAQCIQCFRCVQICADVQGQSVWHVIGRGADARVVPDSGTTLAESSWVGCGACVDTCPSAALTDQAWPTGDVPDQAVRTTCGYCGVGCELDVVTSGDRVIATRPVLDAPVNKGHLCVKGRYATAFAHHGDRVRVPHVREGGAWRATDWPAAIARAAEGLARIKARHGADSIGLLGSARATNEENYLIQKFARVVIGTNNVDSCARVCHTPSAAALKAMLGTGAATNSFDDIEQARAFLIVGANPMENHPVVGARIRQAARRGPAPLIVIDPRRTELADIADVHLALRAGTNIPLLHAMAHVVLAEGLADEAFLAARVDGRSAFEAFIAAWPPERAADLCGVAADQIRAAARLYATAKPAMSFHGLGLTEHVQGTEGVMALLNLALLTGNVGRPGSGINPLRGQNNVQGAAHMGCDPSILTGSAPIAARRDLFERVWNAPLPTARGLSVVAMMDAARAGQLKGLWIVGYDVLATLAQADETRRALAALELVIVQDLFFTETARALGHVFLPAASVFEKDGTFMNAERRIQRVRQALAPPGEARADWRIVADMAAALGHGAGFAFGSAEAIWEEIRAVWPEGRGISYARLGEGGLQWPCPDEHHPGTSVLHGEAFAHGKRASLRCIEHDPSPEETGPDFPFLLTTGRNLYQFNAGTMTGRSINARLRPTDTLDMAPEDARRLGLTAGALMRVESRFGAAVLPLRVCDRIKPGGLFASFHDPARLLNRVTGPWRDRVVGAPEYKVTAVRVCPVED